VHIQGISNDILEIFVLKKYVYDSKEVILTGRVAEKSLRSGKVDKLFEIKPADGEGIAFIQWVRISELFEIIE